MYILICDGKGCGSFRHVVEKKDHCFECLLLCIQMRLEGEYDSFRNMIENIRITVSSDCFYVFRCDGKGDMVLREI